MSNKVIANLGLYCPNKGKFYVCDGKTTEFIGCCMSDPCVNDGKCPDDDLRVSAFSPAKYDEIPNQDCDRTEIKDRASLFYTCMNQKNGTNPFIGCCAENACQAPNGQCPETLLSPAILSRNTTERAAFIGPDSAGGGGLSTGAIVGIAIGSVVAVGILLMVIWRCGWHARKRNERRAPKWESNAPQNTNPEMAFSPTPHSPALYDSRGKFLRLVMQVNRLTSTASYMTNTPQSYSATSPVSPYYNAKHPGSPMTPDDRHLSTYTDSNVSSLSGYSPRLPNHHYSNSGMNLHPVSELDSIEQRSVIPAVELGNTETKSCT